MTEYCKIKAQSQFYQDTSREPINLSIHVSQKQANKNLAFREKHNKEHTHPLPSTNGDCNSGCNRAN